MHTTITGSTFFPRMLPETIPPGCITWHKNPSPNYPGPAYNLAQKAGPNFFIRQKITQISANSHLKKN